MGEPGDSLDLAQEALGADGCGDLGVEHLDGHLAVVLEVVGEEHGGHAAATDLALDSVAIRQSVLQMLQQLIQGAASGPLCDLNLTLAGMRALSHPRQ